MPNDDYTIVCPYYHKVMGDMIFCETLSCNEDMWVKESFIKQKFKDRGRRNICLRRYCGSFNYSECRIAALNYLLYESRK